MDESCMETWKTGGKRRNLAEVSTEHDISGLTLSTRVFSDALNGENLQVVRHRRPVQEKRFGVSGEAFRHVFVCFLAPTVGKP